MLACVSAATLVEVLLGVIILLGIGFAVVSGLPVADAAADEPPAPLPAGPVTPTLLEQARFPLAFRGYRMAEVDEVLERVAEALAERDAELAGLRLAADGRAQPEAGPAEALAAQDWQLSDVPRETEA